MAISKEEILDAVGAMSVMDLHDLIKEMEEKFGVSAAAAAVAAGCCSSWLAAAAAAAEEKTEFDRDSDRLLATNKVGVIKAVRELTGTGFERS